MHDMFVQICGNPFSIVLIAKIHSNHAIKKDKDNEMVDVYMKIKHQQEFILNDTEA